MREAAIRLIAVWIPSQGVLELRRRSLVESCPVVEYAQADLGGRQFGVQSFGALTGASGLGDPRGIVRVHVPRPVSFPQARVAQSEFGVERQGVAEDCDGALNVLGLVEVLQVAAPLEIQIIGAHHLRAPRGEGNALARTDFEG